MTVNVRNLAARVDPGTVRGAPQPNGRAPTPGAGTSFADALRQAAGQATSDLNVSAHAQQRIAQRGIGFDAEQQQAVSDALLQLEDKGARDALLLRADAAFVVNVPSRTVVTAIGQEEMQQRTFTQIDSAMLI